jgi:hypothetical protein
MIAMLRIPRINLDERRKAHLRRMLYNWWAEHNGDVAIAGWGTVVLLLGYGFYILTR